MKNNLTINTLDLEFKNSKNCIACFMLETKDGLMLIDPGPMSTINILQSGLQKFGKSVSDVKYIVLTHIHFDHAGASWYFAKHGNNGNGAVVYVHPFGAPHIINPEKLYNSAKRIYGNQMQDLWGDMNNIDPSKTYKVQDKEIINFGGVELKAWHTPGHAEHHIAWQLGKNLFCGDIMGVKIGTGPVAAPCPPPEFNLKKWLHSIEIIDNINPEYLYLTHFGQHKFHKRYKQELQQELANILHWIELHYNKKQDLKKAIELYVQYSKNQIEKKGGLSDKYQIANPAEMTVIGIYRYLTLQQ